jgi:hypothetical protein
MSWIWPDYLSRDLPATRQERKVIHREAWRLWSANKWNVVLYMILPATYLLTAALVRDAGGFIGACAGASGLAHKAFRIGALVLHLTVCFVVGGAILQRFRFAPCVYRAARRHGYDVCAKCGYWLKGLGTDTTHCPECGAERESQRPGAAGDSGS